MSSETQVTMSYEAMQAELEANGYEIEVVDSETVFGRATAPNGWVCEVYFGMYINYHLNEIYQNNRQMAIDKAWQHYQREKKFTAMEALLEEIEKGFYLWNDFSDMRDAICKVLGKDT